MSTALNRAATTLLVEAMYAPRPYRVRVDYMSEPCSVLHVSIRHPDEPKPLFQTSIRMSRPEPDVIANIRAARRQIEMLPRYQLIDTQEAS